MEAARAFSCSPAALDLFMWASYRCFVAKGREPVPLFGDFVLVNELGSSEYARPRKFRDEDRGAKRGVARKLICMLLRGAMIKSDYSHAGFQLCRRASIQA
jgi:hypothetical protein